MISKSKTLNHDKIEELETICAEAYQVIGTLAFVFDLWDNADIVKIMDNLSQQKLIHKDILPFSTNFQK